MDRGTDLQVLYFAPEASGRHPELLERARAAGIPVRPLAAGVIERVADTKSPQSVLAVAPLITVSLDSLDAEGLVLVAVDLNDPGNAGTLLRAAEAAGAAGVVICGDSVDVHQPKVVRASAGSIVGVPVVRDRRDAVTVIRSLTSRGRVVLAAVGSGGAAPEAVDLTGRVAIVLGGEARGLSPEVVAACSAGITLPMLEPVESLNVAIAGAVLAFEAARQERAAAGKPPRGRA
jgi:TrmH family RNA methyltransferase